MPASGTAIPSTPTLAYKITAFAHESMEIPHAVTWLGSLNWVETETSLAIPRDRQAANLGN